MCRNFVFQICTKMFIEEIRSKIHQKSPNLSLLLALIIVQYVIYGHQIHNIRSSEVTRVRVASYLLTWHWFGPTC
jgi:hypothetical protein